jgi:hypothetical protein
LEANPAATLLSIDADFDVYRDRGGRPLVNLLRRGG